MGTIIFALVLLVVVVACCLYAKNHKKESEEMFSVDNSTPPSMPVIDDKPCVGGGCHKENTSETYEAKPSLQPRDAKGRFVKKTDSQ